MRDGRQRAKPSRTYHRDGSLWAKGQTLDGEMSGYWEWFRTGGTRMRSGHFEAGRQVGEWTTYDRRGAVYKVTQMRAAPAYMSAAAKTPSAYISALAPDRKAVIKRLREVIRKNLPEGFEETIEYGMISYVVPRSLYPQGYLGDPSRPLPFLALASQKQYVSFYHMGLYAGPLLTWFKVAWPKHTGAKLDMGKCCLRLRKLNEVPYELIGELAGRLTPREWIERYEAARGKRRAAGSGGRT